MEKYHGATLNWLYNGNERFGTCGKNQLSRDQPQKTEGVPNDSMRLAPSPT